MPRVQDDLVLQPGDLVWQYQIDQLLGSGAFGNVYQAHHTVMTRRRVALKQLKMRNANPYVVQRFVHESYAMGELLHPNVIMIYELIDPQKYPGVESYFIAMEYLDGGTLQDWMNRPDRPLASLADTARVIKEVCRGLAVAHQERIFHRDIKPANILLSQDGAKVKIGDWGLAHLEEHQMTMLGDILGTIDYMSPEQAAGQSAVVDGRSDLYSVGVMLYEMITSHLCLDLECSSNDALMAFLRRNPHQFANKHEQQRVMREACYEAIQSEKRIDPRLFVPDMPEDLRQLLCKVVAVHPEDRYQTAEELIAALDEVISGGNVPARTRVDERVAHVANLLVEARQQRQDHAYNEAIKLLEQAIDLLPGEVGVCLELARVYNMTGRSGEAARILSEACKNNPDNYVLFRDLGMTFMNMNNRPKALEALRQSLALNPDQVQVQALIRKLQGKS